MKSAQKVRIYNMKYSIETLNCFILGNQKLIFDKKIFTLWTGHNMNMQSDCYQT